MSGDRTMHPAAQPGTSRFEQAPANEGPPVGVDQRIHVRPRRRRGDDPGSSFLNAALAAHEDASGGPTTLVDAEFAELATSVRKWLALSSAEAVATTTVTDRPERRVPSGGMPIPVARWQHREHAVVLERPALLIDAEHVPSDRLPHLLETVHAGYGSPVICRAYADWTRPGLKSWFAQLRHCGIQPIQNFDTPDHGRSLVALSLDALDIVDQYAVTSVVLVGDLGAALPLVTRLRAKGVRVAVIGPARNPDDVRREADEFLDIASLGDTAIREQARHQARHRA